MLAVGFMRNGLLPLTPDTTLTTRRVSAATSRVGGARLPARGLTPAFAFALAAAAAAATGCSGDDPTNAAMLSAAALQDPATCKDCHAAHYEEWSGSMHAYASKDPIFLAMEARGQRETGGALGDFCVNCHAPMAVRTGWTETHSDLTELPDHLQGINCYFCHSVDRVNGAHNNPLELAADNVMRGPISGPLENAPHEGAYSALLDRNQLESADLCGSCHDIQLTSPPAASDIHLERTFLEWKETLFNAERHAGGLTCGACHMPAREDVAADVAGVGLRTVHDHSMAGVDIALRDFPRRAEQLALVQESLDATLRAEICIAQLGAASVALVTLENMAAGHAFPSGAAQDRRLWVELRAFAGETVLYESGVVAADEPIADLADPDLWLIRDTTTKDDGTPAHMFWDVVHRTSNTIPGPVTFSPSDPRYNITHVQKRYPRATSTPSLIPGMPDRVELRVRLRPVGLEVLQDLVDSRDLDEEILAESPTFTLIPKRNGESDASVVWTPEATADPQLGRRLEFEGVIGTCVTNAVVPR